MPFPGSENVQRSIGQWVGVVRIVVNVGSERVAATQNPLGFRVPLPGNYLEGCCVWDV